MSDRMNVPENETGIVRLFSVDLEPSAVPAFFGDNDPGDDASWPVQVALGADTLEAEHVELFPVDDLEGVGLSGYLTEGLGIAEADLAGDRARLDALKGYVLVVRSPAFGGAAQVLTSRAPLRWIGTWSEDRPAVEFEPLPDASAHPEPVPETPALAKKTISDAAMSGRVATVVLIFLALLVSLMIWIAA